MKRHLLAAFLLGGLATACMNWNDGIACRTDLHCLSGDHCGADGGCVAGPRTDAGAISNPDAGRRDGG
jgi:hypothetical protein